MDLRILFKATVGLGASALLMFGVFQLGRQFPKDFWIVYLSSLIVLVIVAFIGSRKFKETGGEEGFVVYHSYNDVFKCLSILAVPLSLMFMGNYFSEPQIGKICAIIYFVIMTMHIAYLSAKVNSLLALPIALTTKILLSVIWVLALVQALDPSGDTAQKRRSNQATAVAILLLLTPIMNMLILDDKGKKMIQDKLKGRRFKGANNLRNQMK